MVDELLAEPIGRKVDTTGGRPAWIEFGAACQDHAAKTLVGHRPTRYSSLC